MQLTFQRGFAQDQHVHERGTDAIENEKWNGQRQQQDVRQRISRVHFFPVVTTIQYIPIAINQRYTRWWILPNVLQFVIHWKYIKKWGWDGGEKKH